MIYISGTKEFKLSNTAVALGKFDGLHRGHQLLIERINRYKAKGMTTVLFTFDMQPDILLSGKDHQLIYTKEERCVIAEALGIDVLIEYPFTDETAHMEPEDFIEKVLVKKLDAKYIAVGEDYRFGYMRSGNIDLLEALSLTYGYSTIVCQKLPDLIPAHLDGNEKRESRDISSTIVRKAIEAGLMDTTIRLLGRPYSVIGEVVHGRKLGRTIGMPTANINAAANKLMPPNGVYYSKTIIHGKAYTSVTNIGYNPTVSEDGQKQKSIETYIFNYKGDLYGKTIEVEFHGFGRPEQKFSSIDELKTQMHQDAENAVRFFTE